MPAQRLRRPAILTFIVRRILIMIPTMLAISVLTFIIIQLPPGDYLTTYIAELQAQGEGSNIDKIEFLRQQYGLDRPMVEQYGVWLLGLLQGDMGYSFEYNLPVDEVVGDRLLLTFIVSFNHHHLYLDRFLSDRRLFGNPSVQFRRS